MKISKLYSNKPEIFEPIEFSSGLNVVLAEIRRPENFKKDTHNLGKTTLGKLIDYTFLSTRDKKFFLFKHYNLFKDFVFFLELELLDSSYLTIRRSVKEATKIAFKKHDIRYQDFTNLDQKEWDHVDVPFERARKMLDSLLGLRSLEPWSYRKGMGYLVRSQEDFQDVFHISKFLATHSDWKPYLAHILGFNADLIVQSYKAEEQLAEAEHTEHTLNNELGGSIEDISKIEGLLLIKRQEVDAKQKFLDDFDFRSEDIEHTKILVNEIDEQIASLNEQRYALNQNRKRVVNSLKEDKILFDPDEAKTLFYEAGILFDGQIKQDFEQLIAFNRAITEERITYLKEELSETENELTKITSILDEFGKRRSESLAYISDTDIFNKYKQVSNELINIRADIVSLERRRELIYKLQALRNEIRRLSAEIRDIQIKIEEDVEYKNSRNDTLFSKLRLYFNDIIKEVIDRQALLSASINKSGHIDFDADIMDDSGNATSASLGHTYRKLMCIAFDMAVLRAHITDDFPRFVFHDGAFESLDDRKKQNLITVFRSYTAQGLQLIVTLIDSDLPYIGQNKKDIFDEGEIILTLHDKGESGLLFKMPSW